MATDELSELLDTAVYKEVASEALYLASQARTQDPGAQALMKQLAGEERGHAELLKRLRERGPQALRPHRQAVRSLRLGEYLTAPETLDGAGLQETLAFAVKREQQSVEFYSRMTGLFSDRDAKLACQRLVQEELGHKLRLELVYDGLFYSED